MNGAERLVQTAAACGVEICFTNPGTTEMQLVAALDSVDGVRGVLALFEGVVTGAADGYARMADKPALTLLHLGPGFANGIANLHNARRARVPVVNLIGHHATWQRNLDPPLNSEVEMLAAPVSGWVRTNANADQLSRDVADAIGASLEGPGQVATLVVPADSQWSDTDSEIASLPARQGRRVDDRRITMLAEALRGDGRTLLLLGQGGLRRPGLEAAGRIAKETGCDLMTETFPKRLERGPDLPGLLRLPYFPEQVLQTLGGYDRIVLAGAAEPVAFFGYPDQPGRLVPTKVDLQVLARPIDEVDDALLRLADALDAPQEFATAPHQRPPRPTGALAATSIAQAVMATLPENSIVVDEGVTAAGAFYPISATGPAHDYLALTGGSIGWGLPCGIGAALACPDRKVLVLEGDGSGLYTAQSFWTQAREGLDVVNLVFNNSRYKILQIELMRAGVAEPGPQSQALTDLGSPPIDWTALSQSLGVPASRVTDAEELAQALERGFAEPGPVTVEAMLPADDPMLAL